MDTEQDSSNVLFVSYAQLAVFEAGMDNPFNDWTDHHVNQGFSWRPHSVSFRTLEESGDIQVSVGREVNPVVLNEAVRAIRVPFVVPASGCVEVATITDGQTYSLPPGEVNLVCSMGRQADGSCWANLAFVPGAHESSAILVKDDDLSVTNDFLMDAEPAM